MQQQEIGTLLKDGGIAILMRLWEQPVELMAGFALTQMDPQRGIGYSNLLLIRAGLDVAFCTNRLDEVGALISGIDGGWKLNPFIRLKSEEVSEKWTYEGLVVGHYYLAKDGTVSTKCSTYPNELE